MEEKSKGISLRKKRSVRPKISAPKQISGPLPTGLAATAQAQDEHPRPATSDTQLHAPHARPQPQGGKTSDLVKRRYSTRYTQLPQDFAPPVPSVPAIPGQFAGKQSSQDGRPSVSRDGERIKVDFGALRDPDLRPEQCKFSPYVIHPTLLMLSPDVASLLADASEQDIRQLQKDLQNFKNRTSTDLQYNVYQNRTQFMRISKEAEKLKEEMRTLRNLMSELTGTLGQAALAGGTSANTLSARKQANRSSIANLEALWSTHLQELWRRVEGSQKYLPAIPGRHIVYESDRWLELNAATWKARRRVHLILLNDHLLVAAEKKRVDLSPHDSPKQKAVQAPVQLVAQRCWPLQDVEIADLANRPSPTGDRSTTSNAVGVRVGAESLTFATSSEDNEKSSLLTSFRKAVELLRKSAEAETQEREKEQDTVNYLATRDLTLLKKPDLLESLTENESRRRSNMYIDVDGKQQSIRWIESQLDDLDMDIALQRFEDAVAKVEKLRRLAKSIRNNALAQDLVGFKINERAAKLASRVTRRLVDTNAWMTTTRKYVDWLARLGFEDRAREAYLDARSAVIKKRIRYVLVYTF